MRSVCFCWCNCYFRACMRINCVICFSSYCTSDYIWNCKSIIGIFIVGKIFIIPIRIITKLIINSLLGAVLLYVINIVGTICGLHIGINVITSLVVGTLGIPGAVLLTVLAIFIWNRAIWERKKTHFFISANGMYGMQKKFAPKGASLLDEWANFLFNCYWFC